jgi:adenylate kinase
MTNLILFGPPGSGKGTQAAKMIEKYGLVHISTGDLFRYEMGNNTPLGLEAKSYMAKGELVPDSVTIGMLRNKVDAHPDAGGFIFDGFPRTIPQAEALDALLDDKGSSIHALIALQCDDEEIVQRIKKRGETSGRPDDNDEHIIRTRIQVYKNETTPVFDFYDAQGKSHSIVGIGEIEEIFGRISAVVDQLQAK